MNFSKETHNNILIEIVNIKRATFNEAEEFKNILLKDIEDGWRNIVVDLKTNSFMDSTFLGALMVGLKTVTKHGGDLRITSAHGDTQAILGLTGANRVLQFFESKEDAIASFEKK